MTNRLFWWKNCAASTTSRQSRGSITWRSYFVLVFVSSLLFPGCSDHSLPGGQASSSDGSLEAGSKATRSDQAAGLPKSFDTRESIAEEAEASEPNQLVSHPVGNDRLKTLFKDWAQPDVAVVITGRQHGYIEPCGCTGLTNQLGGLARRHSLIQSLEARGWPLARLDIGDQVRRFSAQAELKYQSTVGGLQEMNYSSVGFGPDDLQLADLVSVLVNAKDEDQGKNLFVCANVDYLGFNDKFHILEVNGHRIGVTSVLGDQQLQQFSSDLATTRPARDGLREVIPILKEQKCEFYILLAHAGYEASLALAKEFNQFDIVVTAGGADIPRQQPLRIGRTTFIEVGAKGMYVGVVGLFGRERSAVRYQRISLDSRWPDSQVMLDRLSAYQDQLEVLGLSGLGLTAVLHPSERRFVGSEFCADCHTIATARWKETPHSHALGSLVDPKERSETPRHFDPECISCHVTGWEPQRHIPYVSGYVGLDESPLLHDVGCESCHGPGSAHVAAENGEEQVNEAELIQRQKQMRLPLAKAESRCIMCHDLDNSPDFDFNEYWKDVVHKGKN